MSGTLDPRILLRGYAAGIFPMADDRAADDVFWVEPRRRGILPLDAFHVSRSLARRIRSDRFHVTRDTAFHEVLLACADRGQTWINHPIEQATLGLFAAGHAHSIECWRGDGDGRRALVGGIYGIKLGRAFFGESMFSRETDASKVALAWLVARLKAGGFTLFDVQFHTPHLASLGARTVSRDRYSALLSAALGAGTAGGGAAGSATGSATAALRSPGDFFALDGLLAAPGADGVAAAPPGKLIVQLLGQTS